jgi:DNA (cytosine-5)-methyltransferase 1
VAVPAVAHTLRAEADASEDGTGRGTPIVPDVVGCLNDGAHNGGGLNGQDAYSGRIIPWRMPTGRNLVGVPVAQVQWASGSMAVRRLTPTECERLQGFPDGWTAGFSDSTRYRMLGNAVCVCVAEWIARRLAKEAP